MKSSPKHFDDFDFKEEDELASSKFVNKFKNRDILGKYKLLESTARGTNFPPKEMSSLQFVDDTMESDYNCDNGLSYTTLQMEEDPATKHMCGLDDSLFNSTSHEKHHQLFPDKRNSGSSSAQLEAKASSPGAVSPGNSQLNELPATLPSGELDDTMSDADENISGSSSSTSSDIPGDDAQLDGHSPLSDRCSGGWEMGDRNVAVVCPDYIVYRGRYYTDSVLIFSSSCLQLKSATDHGSFRSQWEIDDIVDIQSRYCQNLEVATVKLHLISKDTMQAKDSQGTSGVEELHIAVVDLNWHEKQERIMSLDLRYKALWNVDFNADIGEDREALPGPNGAHTSRKRYFPKFVQPFEEVVYPKGDSDAVSISKRDVDLLQPDTFVNDTIIDFYIKYLKNGMPSEDGHRFHFFNSFFFRKLIDLDKDPSSAFESRTAFQRVRKWTRKVNLFEKDYVFIPVNFNYHWSLIVICHPGEIANFQDEDVNKALRVPCILHMDSIKGSHSGLKDLVQSYLWEEWKERQAEASEHISSKFSNLRFVPLELPQQQNSFDCGLFLLHYVERFLEEAPLNFNPFKITKSSNFLNVDWFPPGEPSLKRVYIQKLIYKILQTENSPAACSDKPCASNYPASVNETQTGVELVSERCSPPKRCHENLCTSQSDQGIEITLLPTSSQYAGDSGLVLREFFEAGAPVGSFLEGQYQAFDRVASFSEFKGSMSLMEQHVEGSGQFVYSTLHTTGFQQLAEINTGASAYPYSSRDFGAETSWNRRLDEAGQDNIDSSPETSICASDDSVEVEINESGGAGEDLCAEDKIDQPISSSAENLECLTDSLPTAPSELLDIPDSQSSDHLIDSNSNANPVISCPETLLGISHQECDVQENGGVTCADEVHFPRDTSVPESDGQKELGNDSVLKLDRQNQQGNDSKSESDGQKQVANDSISEPDEQKKVENELVVESDGQNQVYNDSKSESDGQKQAANDSISEPDEQKQVENELVVESDGQNQVYNDSISEPDEQEQVENEPIVELDGQKPVENVSVVESDGQNQVYNDSTLESDGQNQIYNDSISESDGKRPAKRSGNESGPESDEPLSAKRPRLAASFEGEKRLSRSLTKDLQL